MTQFRTRRHNPNGTITDSIIPRATYKDLIRAFHTRTNNTKFRVHTVYVPRIGGITVVKTLEVLR